MTGFGLLIFNARRTNLYENGMSAVMLQAQEYFNGHSGLATPDISYLEWSKISFLHCDVLLEVEFK